MIFDMNQDGIPDYDPVTQDLYLYGPSNTGFPIAWNPDCIVYKYREYLETRRARERLFWNQLLPEPSGLPLSQKPNYWNNLGAGVQSAPYIFVSPERGICSHHYWDGNQTDRKRTNLLASNISGWIPFPFKYLNLQNTGIELNKEQLLFPYTWVEIVVGGGKNHKSNRKTPSDFGIFEYYGNEMQGKKFPKLTKNFHITKDSFDFYFVIDSQDKVLLFNSDACNWPTIWTDFGWVAIAGGKLIRFPYSYINTQILGIASGDSGSQIYGVRDDVVYFICHYDAPGFQLIRDDIPGDKHWVPDFEDKIYTKFEYSKLLPKKLVKNVNLQIIKESIKNIKDILT